MAADNDNGTKKPAYVSWNAFYSFLGKLKETAIPPDMDSSVMKGLSGPVRSQLRTTFRWLGLVTESDSTTDVMEALVGAHGTPQWKDTLGEVIGDAYADLVGDLNLTSGTGKQLSARFREYNVTGETLSKAVRFYLHALKSAGLAYSPHFTPPSVPRKPRAKNNNGEDGSKTGQASTNGHGGKGRSESEEQHPPDPAIIQVVADKLLGKLPEFNPEWTPEVQTKWFEALSRMTDMLGGENE